MYLLSLLISSLLYLLNRNILKPPSMITNLLCCKGNFVSLRKICEAKLLFIQSNRIVNNFLGIRFVDDNAVLYSRLIEIFLCPC